MKCNFIVVFLILMFLIGCRNDTNISDLETEEVETKDFRLLVIYPSNVREGLPFDVECKLIYLGEKTSELVHGEQLIQLTVQDEDGKNVYGKLDNLILYKTDIKPLEEFNVENTISIDKSGSYNILVCANIYKLDDMYIQGNSSDFKKKLIEDIIDNGDIISEDGYKMINGMIVIDSIPIEIKK